MIEPDRVRSQSRRLLVALAVLAVAFIVSLAVLILVAKPPAYEPVPVPSVSST